MNYVRNLLARQLLWMASQDADSILVPEDADPHALGMEGMSSRLFQGDLFTEPYEEDDYRLDVTAPLWHPVSGVLMQKKKRFLLIPEDGSHPIQIHPRCCRMKAWETGEPMVLLHDRKNPSTGDQILVTEKEYRLADPFPTVYDKAYMLLEYLRLDETTQELVFSFLRDEDYAEELFDSMCRIALEACQSGVDFSAPPEVVWNSQKEENFLKLLGFFSEYMENDLWMLCVLLAVRTLIQMFEEKESCFALDQLVSTAACWCHPSLAEAVERVLPQEEANAFAQMLFSADRVDKDEIRPWLFALLETRIPLSKPVLREISRRCFEESMTVKQLQAFRSSLFSSNAEVLRECVEEMYTEIYGMSFCGLPAALAAIRIHDMQYHSAPIQEEAQRLLLKSSGKPDVLLGIAMMTVYLQFRSEQIRSHREPVVLTREAEVTAKVRSWLRHYLDPFYPYVCELARQLYLSCAVPEDAFADPQLVYAACMAWHERINSYQAEALLSIFPMGMMLPESDALNSMRRALSRQFDNMMQGESEAIVPMFRCCTVLGCWEKPFLLRRFGLLLRKIDCRECYRSWETREYMRRLEWEMLNIMIGPDSVADITANCLSLQASAEKHLTKTVNSGGGENAALLHSFRAMLFEKNADLGQIARLIQDKKPFFEEPRLITDWFYALCTLGLSQEAEKFYLCHKEVLDRPWIYQPDNLGLSIERPYHAASCFWNGITRREKGLELADGMGHNVQDWSLAQQKEHDIYRMQPYIPESGPDRNNVLRFFLIQHSSGKKQKLNYWKTHYDDACATQDALTDPENHSTILHFGYCGCKKMVLAALEADPSHVCYASKALLKDDQVALTVLEQSCRYLHLLFAPVTENREYIKAMILEQGETVVLNRTKEWVRDDKELMLASVEAYPQYFERVSERLRGDREVVLAALKAAILYTEGSYWLRHIFQHIPEELLTDPEIIRCKQERYPD